MRTNRTGVGVVIVAVVIFSCVPMHAAQIALSPLKDNTLYDDPAGALSNGAGERFFVGRDNGGDTDRGVIAFNVAGSVPSGATITGVTLKLNMSKTIVGNVGIDLHRLTSNWGEGTSNAPLEEGGGAASTTGDATWLHTFFSSSLWTTAGGDFSATISGSQTVGGVGSYTWGSTSQMVADVQGWLNSPATNFGWILIGDEQAFPTAKRFDTRENPVTENRPLLTVDYTPAAPEPATMLLVGTGLLAVLGYSRRKLAG